MKKMILIAVWSTTCLASTNILNDTSDLTDQAQHKFEQEQKERQKQFDLSPQVVDSLLENSPAQIKEYLKFIEYSIKNRDEIKPKTLFLHGPSGAGKTETAIAIAKKAGIAFTVISASMLGNEYQNSAKNQLKQLLDPIIKSDQKHVLIIDECSRLIENYNDAKGSREDNGTATAFWDLLDQCIKSKHILVIGTSNSIERCPDMVRTRFGSHSFIEFKMPTLDIRKKILQLHMPKNISCSEYVINQLAKETEGISPRDFKAIIEIAELRVSSSSSPRAHFIFDDFKVELERSKNAKKTEGTINKIIQSTKKTIEDHPVETGISAMQALGALATGTAALVGVGWRIFTEYGQKAVEVAQPVAQKAVEVAPVIAEEVVKNSAETAKEFLRFIIERNR